MNLVLLFESDFTAGDTRVLLTGRRFSHVKEVFRAKEGDELKAGIVDGNTGRAKVTKLGDRFVEMDVVLDTPPPPPLPFTLVCALPRPKSAARILRFAASAGIKRIYLVRTWRVEKSFFESPVLSPESVRDLFARGLEQGCDTVMPRLNVRELFRPFAEDEIPELIKGTAALAAHPEAQAACPYNIGAPVTCAVGPEGGFIDFEIELLEKKGFSPVSMGERPLRVEDAVAALTGRLF
jgi:RsmE family RNA methyltransferase